MKTLALMLWLPFVKIPYINDITINQNKVYITVHASTPWYLQESNDLKHWHTIMENEGPMKGFTFQSFTGVDYGLSRKKFYRVRAYDYRQ